MLPLLGLHVQASGSGEIPLAVILILAGIILLSIAASIWTASYASRKGFPFIPMLVACVFVGFPIPLLIVALAPSRAPSGRSFLS
jgi:hypothetical protein